MIINNCEACCCANDRVQVLITASMLGKQAEYTASL